MLVKFSHTEAESLPANFDEWQNRTTRHLYNENWVDYIVIWRKDRLELYRCHVRLSSIYFMTIADVP